MQAIGQRRAAAQDADDDQPGGILDQAVRIARHAGDDRFELVGSIESAFGHSLHPCRFVQEV